MTVRVKYIGETNTVLTNRDLGTVDTLQFTTASVRWDKFKNRPAVTVFKRDLELVKEDNAD